MILSWHNPQNGRRYHCVVDQDLLGDSFLWRGWCGADGKRGGEKEDVFTWEDECLSALRRVSRRRERRGYVLFDGGFARPRSARGRRGARGAGDECGHATGREAPRPGRPGRCGLRANVSGSWKPSSGDARGGGAYRRPGPGSRATALATTLRRALGAGPRRRSEVARVVPAPLLCPPAAMAPLRPHARRPSHLGMRSSEG